MMQGVIHHSASAAFSTYTCPVFNWMLWSVCVYRNVQKASLCKSVCN